MNKKFLSKGYSICKFNNDLSLKYAQDREHDKAI